MARLSKHVQEKMAVALVKHRFADRANELIAQSRQLFHDLYEFHHDAETRKHMSAITKKHAKAFTSSSSITANVGGRKIEVGERSVGGYWRADAERLPLLPDAAGWQGLGIDAETDFGKRLAEFDDAANGLREQAKHAEREALGMLSQFTTGKRLAEGWPEAMPVIGDLIPEDDRTLPSIQVANLNSKFDLPPALAA